MVMIDSSKLDAAPPLYPLVNALGTLLTLFLATCIPFHRQQDQGLHYCCCSRSSLKISLDTRKSPATDPIELSVESDPTRWSRDPSLL